MAVDPQETSVERCGVVTGYDHFVLEGDVIFYQGLPGRQVLLQIRSNSGRLSIIKDRSYVELRDVPVLRKGLVKLWRAS